MMIRGARPTESQVPEPSRWGDSLAEFRRSPVARVLVVIGALLILGRIISPGFLSFSNIGNVLALSTILVIAALGQMLVIVGGGEGIDLSLGAVVSLGAIFGGVFSLGSNSHIIPALALLVVIGGGIGLINGLGIRLISIPPLVMTLGMASVVDGLVLAYTQGQPGGGAPPILVSLGSGHLVPGVRWLAICGLAVVVIGSFILNRSRYGQQLKLAGSNAKAALLVGINVRTIVLTSYVIAGICSAIAGYMLLGFAGSSDLGIGSSYTLLSIAAVVIGGTQLSGGEGSFLGAALGSVALMILTNVLVALRLNNGAREFFEGLVLVVILVSYTQRWTGRRHLTARRSEANNRSNQSLGTEGDVT